ncbi:MAG: sensor histidine kinase [Deltaproteobacteria bacterium]|nr:sensor histidine kinase [Deltaproteobacteria bacterium]MDQ3295749.1 HAMP domain-containing histidine kinase [Myxococcota bacterium]
MGNSLHDVLATRRKDIMANWCALVHGTIAPEAMAPTELIDHLPSFVDEVIAALRIAAGLPSVVEEPETSETARDHGEQRLRLGFSLDAVVREYGALHDAIIETARNAGCEPTASERQSVFSSSIVGISKAVSEYARQRDAELQRQHNEHVAFLAHELRNPLASATYATELLKTKGFIPTDQRAGEALTGALGQMTELIEHALHMARAATGIELKRELTRTSSLLDDAELVAACEAEDRDIDLHTHIDEDAELFIDRRLVLSALNNLVRNAVKYSCRGGHVELRGSVRGGRAIVEIEDACGGLPPGKVEEAFAPFIRLTTGDESGFGLGLAIAKQAIDAHAGTIRVQNLPGKGCIFVLELPTTAAVAVA